MDEVPAAGSSAANDKGAAVGKAVGSNPNFAAQWDALWPAAPTLENQWKALGLLREWIPVAAAEAQGKVEGSPELSQSLWPQGTARTRFFQIWAEIDPAAAWAAAEKKKNKQLSSALAEILHRSRPDLLAASAAGMKLRAEIDTAAAKHKQMNDILAYPLTRDGIAAMEKDSGGLFGDQRDKWEAICSKLLAQNPAAVKDYLLSDQLAASPLADHLLAAYCASIPAGNLAQAEELATFADKNKLGGFLGKMAGRWDSDSLLAALERPPEPASAAETVWTACFKEMLGRDPSALLSMINNLPSDFQMDKHPSDWSQQKCCYPRPSPDHQNARSRDGPDLGGPNICKIRPYLIGLS